MVRRGLGILLAVSLVLLAACSGGDSPEDDGDAERSTGTTTTQKSDGDDAVEIGASSIRSVVLDDPGTGVVTADAEITGIEGIDHVIVIGTKQGSAIRPTTILGFDGDRRVATVAVDTAGGATVTLADGGLLVVGPPGANGKVTTVDRTGTVKDVERADDGPTTTGAFGADDIRLISASAAAPRVGGVEVPVATDYSIVRPLRVPLQVVDTAGQRSNGRVYGGLEAVCQSPTEAVLCSATVEHSGLLADPVAVNIVVRIPIPLSAEEARAVKAAEADCKSWSSGLNTVGLVLDGVGLSVELASLSAAAAFSGVGVAIGIVGVVAGITSVLSEDCSSKVKATAGYRAAVAEAVETDVVLRLTPRKRAYRVDRDSLTFRPATISTNIETVRLVVGTTNEMASKPPADAGPATFGVAVFENQLEVTQGGACSADPGRPYPTIRKHTIEVVFGPADAVRARLAGAPKRTPGGWTGGYEGISCNFFKVLKARAELTAIDVTRAEAELAFRKEAPGLAPGGVVVFGGDHNVTSTVSGSELQARP